MNMKYDLVFKNGRVIDPAGSYSADVYVSGGKISAIAECGSGYEAACIVDASGKYLFPGAVDAHMHIGEYNADFEDMQTATMAAAAGGITTCIDMPLNLYSSSVVNADIFRKKKQLLSEESYVDFCMWGALVPENLDKLEELHRAGAVSFKSFLSGGGNDFHALDAGKAREALKIISSFGGLAGFHCEDFSIINRERQRVLDNKLDGRQAFLDSRPLSAELIAVHMIAELAAETGARVHICHVTHPQVAEVIRQAQNSGIDITAETCAHYLTFSQDDYLEKGCLFGCAPPLREKGAADGLWEYVDMGVIGCIASDHSPGMPENRSDENQPTYMSGFGISGAETMLRAVYDQGVVKRGYSPEMIARATSETPAKRWGIYGTKGGIKLGFDADIVVFDPEKEWKVDASKLHYKQKITCFDGLTGKGSPESVYIRGVKVCDNGVITVDKGFGQYKGRNAE